MKKHLSTLITILLICPALWAEDIYFNITQTQTVNEIKIGLQAAIDNATSNDRVIVTGSKTDADIRLILYIPTGKVVVWQATYQSGAFTGVQNLIGWDGDGTFEVADGKLIAENIHALTATGSASTVIVSGSGIVQTSGDGMNDISAFGNVEIKDNAQISGTTGEVICLRGENSIIRVSGGAITATSENAICAFGCDSKIYVSGGYVSNNATNLCATIVAVEHIPGSETSIFISGTAKVEAKGRGCAILSDGSVEVSGNAQVSSNLGGDFFTATILGAYSVEVKDNAKVTAQNNYAIFSFQVAVSNNSIVDAKENAIAIYIYNEGPSTGWVHVQDQAQVIAAHNYAISTNVYYCNIAVIGGVVFAYGNEISDVVNDPNFAATFYPGIVLAWNKEAGNTQYEQFSTDDIFVILGSATAHWDKKGSQFGISYANATNIGFIPLDVTVILSVEEPNSPNITVFPNPTSGEFTITNYELEITNVELYDMLGKRVVSHTAHRTPHTTINVSHLPAGIYIYRATLQDGVVCSGKVVVE
jgi:hypothetical protein